MSFVAQRWLGKGHLQEAQSEVHSFKVGFWKFEPTEGELTKGLCQESTSARQVAFEKASSFGREKKEKEEEEE